MNTLLKFSINRMVGGLVGAWIGVLSLGASVSEAAEVATVYKSPTCGCCSKWVTHLERAGFKVETHDRNDMHVVKDELGVPPELRSCHTAEIGGYAIEGHVPADDILRLLQQRPQVSGLAVPGMPTGSPGMEGGTPDAYSVLTFDGEGNNAVFAEH